MKQSVSSCQAEAPGSPDVEGDRAQPRRAVGHLGPEDGNQTGEKVSSADRSLPNPHCNGVKLSDSGSLGVGSLDNVNKFSICSGQRAPKPLLNTHKNLFSTCRKIENLGVLSAFVTVCLTSSKGRKSPQGERRTSQTTCCTFSCSICMRQVRRQILIKQGHFASFQFPDCGFVLVGSCFKNDLQA